MVYVLSFFSAVILALAATPRVIRLCAEWGFMDHPGRRKLHEAPTPLAGGILLFPFAIFGLTAAFIGHNGLFFVLLGTALIFCTGLWDDRFGLHFLTKFLVQVIAALLVMQSGILFDLGRIAFFEGLGIHPGPFPSSLITILWIVGITNAVNLIDGMDGLASGLCLNAFLGIGALALVTGRTGVALLCVVMAAALLGFLRYNIHPARTFLGDSGSLLLGYILAVLSIAHQTKTSTFLVLVVPILLLAIPLVDTVLAFLRRLARSENPFKADREHIHHRLLELNFSPLQTLGLFYTISASMGVLALWLAQTRHLYVLAVAVALLVVLLAVIKGMQVYNLHNVVVRANNLMRAVARKAVGSPGDANGRQMRHLAVLAGILTLNLFLLVAGTRWSGTLAAGSVMLFILGAWEVFLNSRERDQIRNGILFTTVFLSLVVNQLIVLTIWHREFLLRPQLAVSSFALLALLALFLYRTGTFAIFLQDPTEILAFFMGIVVVAVAKHFLMAPSFLPFAVVLANALVIKIVAKIFLAGYRMRSWVHAAGLAVCVLAMVTVTWWG